MTRTLLLNYAHPLTAAQCSQLGELLGATLEERRIAVDIDQAHELAPQAAGLADAAGLAPDEWQGRPLIVNPPGLAPAALALIAELHGRMGHFPTIVRVRPVANQFPAEYEVAELVDLQALRDRARARR